MLGEEFSIDGLIRSPSHHLELGCRLVENPELTLMTCTLRLDRPRIDVGYVAYNNTSSTFERDFHHQLNRDSPDQSIIVIKLDHVLWRRFGRLLLTPNRSRQRPFRDDEVVQDGHAPFLYQQGS
jgi:hypothetical protein